MANIINRTNGDKTLVLGQREGLVYPLPFEDWNSIKIGAFVSVCPTTGFDNNFGGDQVAESQQLNINGSSDRFWFGLKGNNNSLPGDNGEPFVGFTAISGAVSMDFDVGNINSAIIGTNGTNRDIRLSILLPNGYHPASSSPTLPNLFLQNQASVSASTNYCTFFGIRATFVDKGTATQKLTISMAANSNGSYKSDTSDQALRDHISDNYLLNTVTLDYQVGGVPLPPPMAIFVYCPATIFQFRIHNIGVLKSA